MFLERILWNLSRKYSDRLMKIFMSFSECNCGYLRHLQREALPCRSIWAGKSGRRQRNSEYSGCEKNSSAAASCEYSDMSLILVGNNGKTYNYNSTSRLILSGEELLETEIIQQAYGNA